MWDISTARASYINNRLHTRHHTRVPPSIGMYRQSIERLVLIVAVIKWPWHSPHHHNQTRPEYWWSDKKGHDYGSFARPVTVTQSSVIHDLGLGSSSLASCFIISLRNSYLYIKPSTRDLWTPPQISTYFKLSDPVIRNDTSLSG